MHKKQTRILVTGASGFVGQAVCRELLRLGYTPRACLTNIAKWPALQAEVPGLSENAVIGDLTAQPDLREAFQDIDGVIHLAARVHVMRDRTVNPLAQFRRVNVQGSIDLARAAARYGVRHLVYVSSIKVNGEATSGQAFTEDDVPAPVDPYGISKREAEDALRSIAFATGLEVAIVRPPLVYGPGVRANFLRLLKLAEMGIPLPLPDTKNLRSMVHVENLSSLLVRCLEDPGAANQTFLISDGEDLSTRDLICRLVLLFGKKARFVPVSESLLRTLVRMLGKEAELKRMLGSLQVDSGKARQRLQWTPPVMLDEGLKSTVQWYLNSKEQSA